MEIQSTLNELLHLLEDDHHYVTAVCYDVAEVVHRKGSLPAAKKYYELAIGSAAVAGQDHPVQIRITDALGILQRDLGNVHESTLLSRRAYEANVRVLGHINPWTLASANGYAEALHAEGKLDEAQDLYKKTLSSFEDLVGKQHPYCMVINNLGRLTWDQNKDSAMALFEAAHRGYTSLLNEDNIATLTVDLNIARVKLEQGRLKEAKMHIETTRVTLGKTVGENHPTFSVSIFLLGIVATCAGHLIVAQEYFQRAVDGYLSSLGAEHPNTLLATIMQVRVLQQIEDWQKSDAFLSVLESQNAYNESKFQGLSIQKLLEIGHGDFKWNMRIALAWGETTTMRWSGKTWWREIQDDLIND